MTRTCGLLCGLLLLGCDEPLKAVGLVHEPRVLGARVEVAGNAGRAAPAPGESATATFLVASPELGATVSFDLAACPAAPRNGDRAACAGEPFAMGGAVDVETASLDFEVPAELDPAGRVLIYGTVADTAVSLELELARDGDVNLNPTLEGESIAFDDAAWVDLPAVAGDCGGLGFVEAAAGSRHTLQVLLDEPDRDAVPTTSELDPVRESLQLSRFATAGELSRTFEAVAANSDVLARSVTWTAPREPGLVRFWLVLRDYRGGSDFATRAVCVLPP